MDYLNKVIIFVANLPTVYGLLIIAAGLSMGLICVHYASGFWLRRLILKYPQYDLQALLKPTRILLMALVWLTFVYFISLVNDAYPNNLLQGIENIRNTVLMVFIARFLLRMIDMLEAFWIEEQRGRLAWDKTTAAAVGKLIKIIVVIILGLMLLQEWGLSVSAILAFGGMGGIAIGFAAKDMLANFFGGLMLYLDGQFSVGDWICSPDKQIEGTVEYIGWRVTRIRNFESRPLYVPNAVFSSIVIENPSRMQNRRFYEVFSLRYEDKDKVGVITDAIRDMLLNHQAINTRQTLMVNASEYNHYSIDFFVYCFTNTTVWEEFHHIKQSLLNDIGTLVLEHGANFAYPTQDLNLISATRSETPKKQTTSE